MGMWNCDVVYFIICFCVVLGRSTAYDCSVDHVGDCFQTLEHFMGPAFPFYGRDEEELNDTCTAIELTQDCIMQFIMNCDNDPSCQDEECMSQVHTLKTVIQNSGLPKLTQELCLPGSTVRETYLENYHCLEKNADKYEACHNYSFLSVQHMRTNIKDPDEEHQSRCCYFSWYQGCFTNATRDNCNMNATVIISYSLHILMGEVAELMCGRDFVCDRPPLPEGYEDELGMKNTNDINDNSVGGSAAFSVMSQKNFLSIFGIFFYIALKRLFLK